MPCNRAELIVVKIGPSEPIFHSKQIPENDDVVILAFRQPVGVQELVYQIVILLGKGSLLRSQWP